MISKLLIPFLLCLACPPCRAQELVDRLLSADEATRTSAALRIDDLGEKDRSAVARLLISSAEANPDVWFRAEDAFVKLSTPAVVPLIEALRAGDSSRPEYVWESLGKIGPAAVGAAPAVAQGVCLPVGGIGAFIDTTKDRPSIREIIPGKSADKAGLKAGDVIEMIDGAATADMPRSRWTLRVRGKPGETARLTIRRGNKASMTFELTREVVEDPWAIAIGLRALGKMGPGIARFQSSLPDCSRGQDALAFRNDGLKLLFDDRAPTVQELQPVLSHLREPDGRPNPWVVDLLEAMGRRARAALPALVASCPDAAADNPVRSATWAIGAADAEAGPRLAALIGGTNAEAARLALEVLARSPDAQPDFEAAAARCLGRTACCRKAYDLIAKPAKIAGTQWMRPRIAGRFVGEVFDGLSRREDDACVAVALLGLERFEPPTQDAAAALRRASRDANQAVRERARSLLKALGPEGTSQ